MTEIKNEKSEIGVVGLGAMGANLARNFASRKIKTRVFNRTFSKTKTFLEKYKNKFLDGDELIKNFVQNIERPRKILLMVKAGAATDATIDAILPFLESGDILIDGGNSHFTDTEKRENFLNKKNVQFIGLGVSGGEDGALFGPSLMAGGKKSALDAVFPLLEKIAATDFSGGKCVGKFENRGAGHFVKMVHNGIEYAQMQFLAESFWLLKNSGKSFLEIADIFEKWNAGKLKSFLVELSAKICRKKDPRGDGFLLEKVLDAAGQKGTGRWTVAAALDFGVAVPTISAALDARTFSAQKSFRVKCSESKKISQKVSVEKFSANFSVENLEKALFSAMILAYAEGFSLLATAAREKNWNFDFAEISRIWQGGCIIRAELLKTFQKFFAKNPEKSLFENPEIFAAISEMREILHFSAAKFLPTPAFFAAFSEITQIANARGSAHFLQGLRDAFGAHTFRRTDADGIFHEKWEK